MEASGIINYRRDTNPEKIEVVVMDSNDAKILTINMNDAHSEVMLDFLYKWGFSVSRKTIDDILTFNFSNSKPSRIVFQLNEFSQKESDCLRKLSKTYPMVPILATSPVTSLRNIIWLLKNGVCDYIIQPYDPYEIRRQLKDVHLSSVSV